MEQKLHVILDQDKIDALNEKVAAAVNGKLDDAAEELQETKEELEKTKNQLAGAQNKLNEGKDALIEGEATLKEKKKELEAMEAQVGTMNLVEYPGLGELVNGLLQNETDAIVLNVAYLDLLTDMEGYKETPAQLREIHAQRTETIIENVQKDKEDGWNIKDLFGGNKEEEKNNDRVFTMYISGIDTRGGMIAKSRSDVNILATVNVDTRQVLLVSTPRDFYVPLPISNGQPDKLTHAGIYGVDVSIGTLEMLYGRKPPAHG